MVKVIHGNSGTGDRSFPKQGPGAPSSLIIKLVIY
jgi:hypothetical protein